MKLALLVIDMQEHFRELAQEILPELNSVIECAERHGVPVICTQHGHPDPEAEEKTSVLVKWWGAKGSIRLGSHAWQLLPELYRPPSAHVITNKHTYDAFQGTELLELLQQRGIDTVAVSGVMTHFCCETTARSAFTKNFNVLFLDDGCATSTQRHHKASLLNLADGFATIMSCAELRALLEENNTKAGAGSRHRNPRNVKW